MISITIMSSSRLVEAGLAASMHLDTSSSFLGPPCQVSWVGIGTVDAASLPQACQSVITQWLQAGVAVGTTQVHTSPFWGSVDAEVCPALQQATLDSLGV